MGAYLSQPKTDKVSTDELNELLAVGASSMQGWRNSQEDAHNSILNFDNNTSFFAVYDGHGGAEVATYCADKLPKFLKELQAYKSDDLETALREAFLGFDKTLLDPPVVEILKILAGEKNFVDGEESDARDDEDDDEDLVELHEESNLPLNVVLEKYKVAPSMPLLKKLKEGDSSPKPQSPYLRGRRAAAVAAEAANKAVMDPDAKPQGSSTSAAAAAGSAAGTSNDAGPSSSKTSLSMISKMETDGPEEDSTVSSSSSSASKSNNNNSHSNTNANNVTPTPTESAITETANAVEIIASDNTQNITTNGSSAILSSSSTTAPDSSHVKEQNGSVTSSETNVSTSAVADIDAIVSASSDAAIRIQNGTVGSTSSSSNKASSANADGGTAISSTSKELKKLKKVTDYDDDGSADEDFDYDVENSSAEEDPCQELSYSSEEDVDEDDADDSSAEDSSEEDAEEDDDDDDECALANEQFCANMIEEPGKDSGCTAVVALLQGRDLYVANAGDSRCVVCRNGKAIEMSLDHKPEDDEESARIIKAGGRVTIDGRVNGGLNLSRAIGDHAYKMNLELLAEEQMISALPDIKKLIIAPEDEFMVLACDGIWNFMSSEEVVDFVRLRLKDASKKLSQICEELFDNCLAPDTSGDGTGCDNMTAVIVRFQPKLLELPTKINPNETEEVLVAKQAAAADAADASLQKSLKRSASPTSDDNSNEAENANKTKRLKTDGESSSNTTTTTTAPNSNDIASSSATATEAATAEQTDCGVIEATVNSEAAAVSST